MSSIPAMTEPDPCPFEQANLLTEEVVEPLDLDLLADLEDSEEERPVVKNNVTRGLYQDTNRKSKTE